MHAIIVYNLNDEYIILFSIGWWKVHSKQTTQAETI